MKKDEATILSYSKKIGRKGKKVANWRWFMALIFSIPAILLIIVGSAIFALADFLLFGTHHFSVSVTPNK